MGILDTPPTRVRPTVAVLVIGQSNEQGAVPISDRAAYPQAFVSAKNPGVVSPGPIPVRNRGGWWHKVYDDLYDWGYDLRVLNGAVGGMSLLTHCCGYVQTRANSTAYYKKRTTANFPDRGDFGDIYAIGSKYFVVTGNARNRSAFNSTPHINATGANGYQDFVSFSAESLLSGGSAPDVSAVALGGTVSDGDLTLTCIGVDNSRYGASSTYDPLGVLNLGGVLGEPNAGYGFDPLGILTRAWEMLAATHATRRIVYFAQGQADLGNGSTTYARAVLQMATFFLNRNVDVVLGNTTYSPASSFSTSANYQAQVDGCASAKATLDTHFPGRVYLGANLYSLMGTTGPMGGQSVTASMAGTTLTVSAVKATSGSGIAVGQNVWNGQTLVGTVVSQLSGTPGGVGTYQISASATISSTTIVCAGSWLQYDGIHINGAGAVGQAVGGVSCAGKHVADSLKAILPQR